MSRHPCALILVGFLACDASVQQQKAPRIPDDPNYSSDSLPDDSKSSGSDIVAEEEGPLEPKKETTPEERRQRCCEQCVSGYKQDKTGDAPEAIKCQDFVVQVKNACQKWFNDNPMSAADAYKCVGREPDAPAPRPPAEE
jgi:hypothetical protein